MIVKHPWIELFRESQFALASWAAAAFVSAAIIFTTGTRLGQWGVSVPLIALATLVYCVARIAMRVLELGFILPPVSENDVVVDEDEDVEQDDYDEEAQPDNVQTIVRDDHEERNAAIMKAPTVSIPLAYVGEGARLGWTLCHRSGWRTPADGLAAISAQSDWRTIAASVVDGQWSHKKLIQGGRALVLPAASWHAVCAKLVDAGVLARTANGGGEGYDLTEIGKSLFEFQRELDNGMAGRLTGLTAPPAPQDVADSLFG